MGDEKTHHQWGEPDVGLCKCGHPHGNHSGTYGSGPCSKCGERHCESYRAPVSRGELGPLPRPCGRRFCRKNTTAGGVFCEAHGEAPPEES
jgi:hypothetical protein